MSSSGFQSSRPSESHESKSHNNSKPQRRHGAASSGYSGSNTWNNNNYSNSDANSSIKAQKKEKNTSAALNYWQNKFLASSRSTPAPQQSCAKVKAILLGDSGVGKTTFLQSLVKGKFCPSTSTSDINNSNLKKIMHHGGRDVELDIFDTAGQERFRSITASYYRYAQGCFLFFSVNNDNSFKNVNSWLDDIRRYGPREPIEVILIGLVHRPHLHIPISNYNGGHRTPPTPRGRSSSFSLRSKSPDPGLHRTVSSQHIQKTQSNQHQTRDAGSHRLSGRRHMSGSEPQINNANYVYEEGQGEHRQVRSEQAILLAKSHGIPYYESDVRNDPMSTEVVVRALLDRVLARSEQSSLALSRSIKPDKDTRRQAAKGKLGCCYAC